MMPDDAEADRAANSAVDRAANSAVDRVANSAVDRATDKANDPTLVRNQAALTTSTGRIWLVLGGLLAVIAAAVMVGMLSLRPPGTAAIGIVSVVVLYVAMVVVQLVTRRGRLRLGLQAALMISIALVGLVCVFIVASAQPGVAG